MRRLLSDRRGASAVEFALVGPALLTFIFLLIEGGRMEWTRHALQEVAFNGARCMALGTDACNSTSAVQTYTRGLGSGRGVSLARATITAEANQTCNAVTGMNKVSIDLPYTFASGLLPFGPNALQAVSCFPSVT